MFTVGLVVQAVLLAVTVMGIFGLIGYGIVAVCAPDLEGDDLLIVPGVGFAIAVVSCTWLSPVLAAPFTVTILILTFGIGSVFLVWRRRTSVIRSLSGSGRTLCWGMFGAIAIYLGLLGFVFAAHRFAYDGNGIDALVLYAPAIEYLKIHPYSLFVPSPVVPGEMPDYALQAMRVWGQNAFPALGRVDAAISALTGWPGYQLIEPLDAWFIAFSLFPLYALFKHGFACSRRVAVAATVFSLINQLNVWVFGMGFSSHTRAMLLFPTCLLLIIAAVRTGTYGVAILAGVTSAALVGIYFPVAVLLILAAGAYVLAVLVHPPAHNSFVSEPKPTVLVMLCTVLLALPSLFTFFGVQGFHEWLSLLQVKFPGAGIETFFPVRAVLGIVPLTDVMQGHIFIGVGSTTFWHRPQWEHTGNALAAVIGVLGMLGFVTLLWERKLPEVTMVFAIAVYVLYIRFVARYPYGFMRLLCYVLPFTSMLVALGAIQFPWLLGRSLSKPSYLLHVPSNADGTVGRVGVYSSVLSKRSRTRRGVLAHGWRVISIAGMGTTMGAQLFAWAAMERYIAQMHTPEFPPGASGLTVLQDLIPLGAHVYMYNDLYGPANAHFLLVAASFLHGRAVTVQGGFNDADPATDRIIRANGFQGYDYILLSPVAALRLVGSVERVWQDSQVRLQLYRRTANNIAFLSEEAIMPVVVESVLHQLAARGVRIDVDADRDAVRALMQVYMERPELQFYGPPDALDLSEYLGSAVSRAPTSPPMAPYVDRYAVLARQATMTPPIQVDVSPLSTIAPMQLNPRYQNVEWRIDELLVEQSVQPINGPYEYPHGSAITVGGFALDPTTNVPASGVTILIDGAHDAVGEVGLARSDSVTADKSPASQRTGFRVVIPSGLLPAGQHRLTVKIASADSLSYFVPPWSLIIVIT